MYPKVTIILTELSIPFETTAIWDATELKKAPYTDVNPNGRAPGKASEPDDPSHVCMLNHTLSHQRPQYRRRPLGVLRHNLLPHHRV